MGPCPPGKIPTAPTLKRPGIITFLTEEKSLASAGFSTRRMASLVSTTMSASTPTAGILCSPKRKRLSTSWIHTRKCLRRELATKTIIRGKKSFDWKKRDFFQGGIEIYQENKWFTLTGARLPGYSAEVEQRQEQLNQLGEYVLANLPKKDKTTPSVANEEPAQPDPPFEARNHHNGNDDFREAMAQHKDVRPASRFSMIVPGSKLTDQELLQRAGAAVNGEAFIRLWNGSNDDYGGDASSGDLAFLNMLAFWCGGDAARIESLARRSERLREKWDSKRNDTTWLRQEIAKAIRDCSEQHAARTNGNGTPASGCAKEAAPWRSSAD